MQAAGDRLAVSQRELEDTRRQLRDAERNAEELGKAPMEMQVPELDIVIRLDGSASTSGEIEGVKREITDLGNVLDILAPSAKIGVVAHGDRRWRNPIYVQKIAGLSRPAVPERFVRGLEANMNDPRGQRNLDVAEALATALDRAAVPTCRSVSQRRYIVMVTDAPRYAEREQAGLRMAQSFASVPGTEGVNSGGAPSEGGFRTIHEVAGNCGERESYRRQGRRDDARELGDGDIEELNWREAG